MHAPMKQWEWLGHFLSQEYRSFIPCGKSGAGDAGKGYSSPLELLPRFMDAGTEQNDAGKLMTSLIVAHWMGSPFMRLSAETGRESSEACPDGLLIAASLDETGSREGEIMLSSSGLRSRPGSEGTKLLFISPR